MTKINLADAFGLEGLDEATTTAIAGIGYTIQVAPGNDSPLLGEGTFAEVFSAQHTTGRWVAIKVIRDTTDGLRYFENETLHLENPNFPTHYANCSYGSYHQPPARPFIVLEYLRGKPIDEYAKNLGVVQCVALIEQVAGGVAAYRKAGIVHRDIHAGNVYVTEDGRVRGLDHGFSSTMESRNKTVEARGNRDCTPPEVFQGKKRADDRDDVYSLAALSIQVLTGATMPKNDTRSGDPKHLARCRKQLKEKKVDKALSELLLAGLKSWEDRTVLASTLAEQLEDWRVRRPLRQRNLRIVGFATLLVSALVFILTWHLQEENSRLLRRDVEVLGSEISRLPNANHPAVVRLVEQAAESADAAQAKELLRRGLRIGQSLEGSRQRREALGVALNETAWTRLDTILQRRQALSQLYGRALSELESGDAERASDSLDELQKSLAELSKDNVVATSVLVAKQQYEHVAKLIPDRLRNENRLEIARFDRWAGDGLEAAAQRHWNEAVSDFGQARTQLIEWLQRELTPNEHAAFRQATVDQVTLMEQQARQLRDQLSSLEKRSQQDQLQHEVAQRLAAERQIQLQTELRIMQERLAAKSDIEKLLTSTKQELLAVSAERDRIHAENGQLERSHADVNRKLQFMLASLVDNTPPIVPQPGEKLVVAVNGSELDFVWCPPGRFEMGSPLTEEGRDADELQSSLDLPGFWMMTIECTEGLWQAVMGGKPEAQVPDGRLSKRARPGNTPKDNPKANISAQEAESFAARLQEIVRRQNKTLRRCTVALPTEEQFEYATRAGTRSAYFFGDSPKDLDKYAWYQGNSGAMPHSCGAKLPNPWGLYDMCGGVWDLTKTIRDDNGRLFHVYKGGSYKTPAKRCRSAHRSWDEQTAPHDDLGFRVVLTAGVVNDSEEVACPICVGAGKIRANWRAN